jgi:hypothetical protein
LFRRSVRQSQIGNEMPAIRFIYLRYDDTQNRASPSSCVSNYSQSKGAAGETCRRIGGSAEKRIGVSAYRRGRRIGVSAWSGCPPARPALHVQGTCDQLMKKRRCSRPRERGSGRATPVARERNPTARRVPTRRYADPPIRFSRRYVSPVAP